ncbi:probable inactive purple acid phosphatase 1 isoform X2 [Phalaenopsis equestris]|uniref:probable inactive purple acid phosphatase 1 isoform X2 n=1 Tax=Phalaenopsis equestris TaxID=78828 RepID=UPI0009E5A867|nr:probable inactive purple acid phosphatase 1 isoform X2 [Phalaenopsis equestris]
MRIHNRRILADCIDPNPYLFITASAKGPLADETNVTVTVGGVLFPDESDWIAMITPSNAEISSCPLNSLYYVQTGDISCLPLLCHYPVKAQYVSSDPSYLNCGKKKCEVYENDECLVHSCSASITFHVVNFRTDIEFVFFSGGFATPCILKRSDPISFANPNQPLYGHLSSIDSTATKMRVTWVSGDENTQVVEYGQGRSSSSRVSTFKQDDMCSGILPSPAKDFGWHEPGYIHTAVMNGLLPNQTYSYRYGSDLAGWSEQIKFKTPPASGSNELKFLAYGDMGKAPLDPSMEHYIQPGSVSVVKALANEVASGNVDSIFHIGDISYATGFLVEWDFFLSFIAPLASHVAYMTAIGNHERDYEGSGSVYITPDSGGECGVAYETYFPMPSVGKDKPWYSLEQATVHFTVISTEHEWKINSEQYNWIYEDLASVDRRITPWSILLGHRPMYSSYSSILPSVDSGFVESIEPVLMKNKVDLVFFGHVHNYERTCSVYQKTCKGLPTKVNGIDTYDNTNYTAPIHATIGMGGFTLDDFSDEAAEWSLIRISEFGYVRVHATTYKLSVESLRRMLLPLHLPPYEIDGIAKVAYICKKNNLVLVAYPIPCCFFDFSA